MKRSLALFVFASIVWTLAAIADKAIAQSKTLGAIKERGFLNCGVNSGIKGFSAQDEAGKWSGIDVDFCRALAAAIFKDGSKVKFLPQEAGDRFKALESGTIDVLSRNTTWTMARDTKLGARFVGIVYYDGQGFMVKSSLGVVSVKELSGATVCVQKGTTSELNLGDYFRAHQMDFKPVVFEKREEAVAAYGAGQCDAFTSDISSLYSVRVTLSETDDHVVLPEVISKEPLGPAVKQGDSGWANIVRWILFALINAEELGVSQKTVEESLGSTNPEVKRLLGKDGDFGVGLGLENDWAYQAIKQVGNYGEAFDRNLGAQSKLGISRGQNALWKDGGLMYAPPIR